MNALAAFEFRVCGYINRPALYGSAVMAYVSPKLGAGLVSRAWSSKSFGSEVWMYGPRREHPIGALALSMHGTACLPILGRLALHR